jgi:hypothetical protein
MKNTKSILFAAIAAVAVGSASAQTTNVVPRNQINLAGSTAFRSVHLKELNTYALGQGYTLVASDSSPSLGTGNLALYTKLISSATNAKTGVVTQTRDFINARFQGAEGGTLLAGSKNTQGFYGLRQTGVGSSPVGTATNLMSATITYADSDQSVGVFSGSRGAKAKAAKLTFVGNMAAINFAFCTTKDFPANNITERQAAALYTRGHLPLSFFTGNPSDSTNGVYAMGRNIDSGTRTAILTEIGVGSLNKVNQYDYAASNNSLFLTPAGTLPGLTFLAGDGGDDSGGTLCTKVAAATNLFGANVVGGSTYTGKVYVIAYSGIPDINTRHLKVLSYNGTAPFNPAPGANTLGFQTNFNGIANGTYSLFSIGKVYVNAKNAPKGTIQADVTAVAQGVANGISTNSSLTLGGGNTAISDLNIVRNIEGTTAQPK